MIRVLLVDDEPAILRALIRVLRGAGMEAHGVPNFREALSAMDNLQPDMVVTDYNLSTNFTGDDVGNAADVRRIPWVLYTANVDCKGDNVLHKPIPNEELVAKIRGMAKKR